MKKIFVLILAAIAIVSCGTAKHYSGNGISTSSNRNVAELKAFYMAAADVSRKSNVDVSVNGTMENVESSDGNATQTFAETTQIKSETELKNLDMTTSTTQEGGKFRSNVIIKNCSAKPAK